MKNTEKDPSFVVAVRMPRFQKHGTMWHMEEVAGLSRNMVLRLFVRWMCAIPEQVRWALACAPAAAQARDVAHWSIISLSTTLGHPPYTIMHALGRRPSEAGLLNVNMDEKRRLYNAFPENPQTVVPKVVSRIIWTALCLNLPGRDVLIQYLEKGDRITAEYATKVCTEFLPKDTPLSVDDERILAEKDLDPIRWLDRMRGLNKANAKIIEAHAQHLAPLQAQLARSPILDLSAMFLTPYLGPEDIIVPDADEPSEAPGSHRAAASQKLS